LKSGRFDRVHTRFPPEPNAFLHIGHAKALWINYWIAQEFGGQFNLRFDDTNPEREEQQFVDAIVQDVHWVLSAAASSGTSPSPTPPSVSPSANPREGLSNPREGLSNPREGLSNPSVGLDEEESYRPPINGPLFASDYFDQMFEWAIQLIEKGKAYVCDLSPAEVIETRGTPTSPGSDSPYRSRSVEENLDLFRRMNSGEFPEGARTLRAKIDMAHPNILMRDPVMYRIKHAPHHRQGDKWDIYPMYDWAHGLEDSIEGITHSLCSLEYENHRPLYDWFLDELGIYHPRQIEFVRATLTYTVMSKRKFVELVKGGHVGGYDDPRLPTLAGARRRGYTPEAIREFCRRIGVGGKSAVESRVDMALLQDCVREDLNRRAPRVMGVLNPVRLVITNYPEGRVEELDCVNNPEDPSAGTRKVPFSRELYIEREDFMADPPPKFFRLAPGREVRLRYAYFVTCTDFDTDESGEVTEIRCTYDPATKGGDAPDGRKVKATMHWVSAPHSAEAEVRLYDHLFRTEDPDDVPEGQSYLDNLNPDSLRVVSARVEPTLREAKAGDTYQFERMGYFCADLDSTAGKLVFNRTATLRDTWANIQKRTG
jgi:glutaminyl-tRNA synthetase